VFAGLKPGTNRQAYIMLWIAVVVSGARVCVQKLVYIVQELEANYGCT